MFKTLERIEDCELSTIISKREEIRVMLNKLLNKVLNCRMERAYEKQLIEEDTKAKRSLEMKEGPNGGKGCPRKKVTNDKS